MITKEEYSAALETVLKYHQQIRMEVDAVDEIINPKDEKTIGWFLDHTDVVCSTRLRNILRDQVMWYEDMPLKEYSKSHFLKMRNAGRGGWAEFERLRDSVLNKWT
jgi:hypothetical protein